MPESRLSIRVGCGCDLRFSRRGGVGRVGGVFGLGRLWV